RGDRLFIAHAVLKTAEDGARPQYRLQLLDGVQRVVTLDGKEDIVEGTPGLGDARPSGEHRLVTHLAGGDHPDAVAGDGRHVRLTPHQSDLTPGLGQTRPQQ